MVSMQALEESAVDAVDYANASIGADLKARRQAANLTQNEVAAKASIRPETVSRIESGRGNPTVGTIRKILSAIRKASK